MAEGEPKLARRLSLFDATMIVISGIVGSGIFINPYVVADKVGRPGLIIAVWVAGGVVALAGAFVFAELGTVLPRAGGQYAFFREAFHPAIGFLHGWSLLLIVQSAATAAVAIACSKYVVSVAGLEPALLTPIAVGLLVALSAFHALGIKPGAVLINVITVGKVLALGVLIVAALATSGVAAGASPPGPARSGLASAFLAAMVPTMFSYGGWQNVNFVAEEVRDPLRTLPRAILVGVLCVIAVYIGANVAYLHVLGAPALAGNPTFASEVAARALGPAFGKGLGILIIVSTFGFLNLALMTAPRVYYAMAADGLFFRFVARVSPRTHAPVAAILTQGALATVFAFSNRYEELLGYAVFSDWIFFALAGVAVIVFRRTRPDAPRPLRVPLYPLTPLFFAAVGVAIVFNMFTDATDARNARNAVAILALGLPVYGFWRWRERRRGSVTAG